MFRLLPKGFQWKCKCGFGAPTKKPHRCPKCNKKL